MDYYGFRVDAYDIRYVALGLYKHGIKKGFLTLEDRIPTIATVFYYVQREQLDSNCNENELSFKFKPLEPKLLNKLLKVRKKVIQKCGIENVSEFKFFDDVGYDYPRGTKHASVDVKYETSSDEEESDAEESDAERSPTKPPGKRILPDELHTRPKFTLRKRFTSSKPYNLRKK